MSRPLACLGLAVLALTLLRCPAARAADDPDDPVLQTRHLSEWTKLFREARDARTTDENEHRKSILRRPFTLDVFDGAGPKTPGVLAEVYKTLKDDPDGEVRARAARWLGDNARASKDAEQDPK